MARASRPRRAASSASSSGCDAPSRKLKLEWQCSSAYGTDPRTRCTAGTYGWRLRDHAGLSPPLAYGGRFVGRPSLRRRSSSFQGIAGLLKPTPGGYRTGVRLARDWRFSPKGVSCAVLLVVERPGGLPDPPD